MKWNGNNAQQIVDRWKSGVGNAAQSWVNGTQRVTENPVQRLLEAEVREAAIRGFTAALNSDAYVASVNAVTLEGWKQQCKLGAQNYVTGATKGAAKFNRFVTKFGPVWTNIQQTVRGMPKGGIEAAMARVRVAVTALHNAGRRAAA